MQDTEAIYALKQIISTPFELFEPPQHLQEKNPGAATATICFT